MQRAVKDTTWMSWGGPQDDSVTELTHRTNDVVECYTILTLYQMFAEYGTVAECFAVAANDSAIYLTLWTHSVKTQREVYYLRISGALWQETTDKGLSHWRWCHIQNCYYSLDYQPASNKLHWSKMTFWQRQNLILCAAINVAFPKPPCSRTWLTFIYIWWNSKIHKLMREEFLSTLNCRTNCLHTDTRLTVQNIS